MHTIDIAETTPQTDTWKHGWTNDMSGGGTIKYKASSTSTLHFCLTSQFFVTPGQLKVNFWSGDFLHTGCHQSTETTSRRTEENRNSNTTMQMIITVRHCFC